MSADQSEFLLLSICLLDSRAPSICIKVEKLTVSASVFLGGAEPRVSWHYTVYECTARAAKKYASSRGAAGLADAIVVSRFKSGFNVAHGVSRVR